MVRCSYVMRHESVTMQKTSRVDWKGIGYLVSIVSVFFLGSIAWPTSGEPRWHMAALIAGMATSIVGMAFRYKAHLDQQRELKRTKAEARRS